MFFSLLLSLLVLAATPSVALTVTQRPGPKNIHLHYVVTGPYEGRACLDVDDTDENHVAVFCADTRVSVKAGARAVVDDDVHGPAGMWVVTPALPDTPGDDDIVLGVPQPLTIAQTLAARR